MKLWKRTRKHIHGLGDAVELVAKPVAQVIDAVAGTNFRNCPACEQRRQKLNRAVPFLDNTEQFNKDSIQGRHE